MSPVVIAVQETWLINKNKFNKREYQVLRQDRKANDGRGGVLLIIQQNVACTIIQLQSEIEVVAARLYLGDTIVDVASAYIPPAVNFNKEQLDQLVGL